MTKTVNVTQAHISAGKRGACRECPVALALIEQHFPDADKDGTVFVNGKRASVYRFKNQNYDFDFTPIWASLPESVHNWIMSFDTGLVPVQPITFDLTFTPVEGL